MLVTPFQLNSMAKQLGTLSNEAVTSLRKLNWVDYRLYQKAMKRLLREVDEIGPTKVQHYVDLINQRVNAFVEECVEPPSKNFRFPKESWIDTVDLRAEKLKNQTCIMLSEGNIFKI